jgi:hypothetical protein
MASTLNLKKGWPKADQAIQRLIEGIDGAERNGEKAIIIIHGYGSTGAGGTLRLAIREFLEDYVKKKRIRLYIKGENWSIWKSERSQALELCPELENDEDLNKLIDQENKGITIVILKKSGARAPDLRF